MSWSLKTFDELDTSELYSILQIRNAVFIVEQDCPYQDLDNKDLKALHLFYTKENSIIAYCRVLAPGISYPECSVGRVLTVNSARSTGLGKVLFEKALYTIQEHWPGSNVRISAQTYLVKFYETFDFKIHGEIYEEDHLPHIEMLLDVTFK